MMVLTTIVLIETILLKLIVKPNHSPPLMIQNLSKFVENNAVFKYFVVLPFETSVVELKVKTVEPELSNADTNDDNNDQLPETPKIDEKIEKNWNTFCRITDRLCFIGLAFGYALFNGF